MTKIARFLNALFILTISAVLLLAYGVQFLEHEVPCPLCMLQRLGMIGVATGALMNLRFGIKMSHYGISLLSCLAGGSVALRQISLHVCPGFATFGMPVLGLSLYTWSFIVFACSVLAISILLFLYNPKEDSSSKPSMNFFEKLSFSVIFVICGLNVITTYLQCGFGPCE